MFQPLPTARLSLSRRPKTDHRPVAHQRRIRDREAALDPRPIMGSLEGCAVAQIPFAEAKALITRYEWLGSMPPGARACYGLKDPDGELVGVVVFGPPPSPESRDLCGPQHRELTICLARGACVHWAHPHAASFMISRACKLAAAEFGWRVFYAYADPMAGEIGTVYQACNWRYLGVGADRGKGRWRFFNRRDLRWRSDRMLSRRKLKVAEVRAHPDWIAEWTPDKGRYAWFEGTRREKRTLKRALKYAPQAYPKRATRGPGHHPNTGGHPQIFVGVPASRGHAFPISNRSPAEWTRLSGAIASRTKTKTRSADENRFGATTTGERKSPMTQTGGSLYAHRQFKA